MSLAAEDISGLLPQAWTVAEQRSAETVAWMTTTYGANLYLQTPAVADFTGGRWAMYLNDKDWRNGFWPGTLWLLAQRTGSEVWKQRAINWSAPLATSSNSDHDIGFIILSSHGKALLYHDDLNDPGGAHRTLATTAITTAATKLDSRFNKPNTLGQPIPAGATRSWNTPFQGLYPVCVDNLMNLEVMFLAYELNGRQPAQWHWFDHALTHARTSIARHLRADGGTYHVVRHFETGPLIGQVERKHTHQGYSDETTWSRGQAWALYGFTTVYRYARKDPATDASDILAAAHLTADYFIDHLPHYFTDDSYNHRIGDFVPPNDFDAALGEPIGPWNGESDNYDPDDPTTLGERRTGSFSYTPRDSSAAAIAAAGLIELSGYVTPANRARYLAAAEDILKCLITYDGDDVGSDPDYLSSPGDPANPGILKLGNVRSGEASRSVIYGDYYFLEALARYEALKSRELLARSQQCHRSGGAVDFVFETTAPSPALTFRVLRSPDLSAGSWTTVASKTGTSPWSGVAAVGEESLPDGRKKVVVGDPSPGHRGFFRILTRSAGGGN